MNNDAISNPMCLLESAKAYFYDRFARLGSRRQRAVFAPERDAPERGDDAYLWNVQITKWLIPQILVKCRKIFYSKTCF